MSARVTVLLFLSALLSALTGVGVGPRQQQVAQSMAQPVAVVATPARRAVVALLPAQSLPALIAVAARGIPVFVRPVALVPAFADRRRE